MDEHLTALLDELHAYGAEHDAGKPDRLDRLRNLEPDTARLLALLVRATGSRAVLELGTSNGYSTLWLADSARAVGGRVVSVELDPGRSSQAARNLDRAGLRPVVELRVQDAADALKDSPDAAWDMIFLDAERPAYPGYRPDLVRTLKPGGLLGHRQRDLPRRPGTRLPRARQRRPPRDRSARPDGSRSTARRPRESTRHLTGRAA